MTSAPVELAEGAGIHVAPPPRGTGERRRRRWGDLGALLFVAPALILVLGLFVIPAAVGVWHSFTGWVPGYESPFVGLANYRRLLVSPIFHQILVNQMVLLLAVPLATITAILIAVLVFERIPAPGVFRTVLFFPAVLPASVAGIAFVNVLLPDGPLNSALSAVGLSNFARPWLADPNLVKPVLVVVLAWSMIGVGVIIFSSALGTISRDVFESARMDGANWWQEIRHIVIPGLRPTIEVYVVLCVLQVFLWSFPWIYVMTAGGPGYASTTIDWDVYQNTIRFGRFGLGAAEAVITMVLVGLLLLITARMTRRRRP